MKSFEGKVAAVTGAASGIGRALAEDLAGRGCHLALADVDAAGLEGTVARIEAAGGKTRVTTRVVDVARRDEVYAWADETAKAHGKVNVIVNNAGVGQAGTVEGTSIEDYEWVLGINLWGVIYGTKAFLPHLRAAGEGHVVNVSSVFGLQAQPTMSAYNASKFAVRGFTESLRQELDALGGGVSATCVHPGGIATNIAKSGRVSESIRAVTGDVAKSQALFARMLKTPAKVAAAVILEAVLKNERRVLIGNDAKAMDLGQRLFPKAYQRANVLATKYVRSRG